MHKVLLISGLALTLAGCAASQEAPSPVQVQDLSSSRSAERPASYTVEAGDTLYGIAWRHDMDYRDLARLNRIEPPYNIQPGQQLTLGGGAGSGSDGRGGDAGSAVSAGAAGGAVATGLGGASQDDGSLDWLLPDGGSERSGDEAQAEAASDGGQASDGEGAQGPGPVYDPESPGADGTRERERPGRAPQPRGARAGGDGRRGRGPDGFRRRVGTGCRERVRRPAAGRCRHPGGRRTGGRIPRVTQLYAGG
ncbi:LysM peptidoglycan-binding domain-containing protein [Halomonas smyrnensis]|uniref:LysM peptidoglycan-binding domain-containing protein n=1 Tax=Halomonas smyrnensis TaxID=720605 RepID=UPI0002FA6B34|nr:LysM domain-containing protein [Halomonas smyrnensis]